MGLSHYLCHPLLLHALLGAYVLKASRLACCCSNLFLTFALLASCIKLHYGDIGQY